MIIISGIAFIELNAVNDEYTSTIREGINKIHLTSNAISESYRQEIELQTYLATGNPESLEAFDTSGKEFQKHITNLTSHTNHEDGLKLVDQISSAQLKKNQ